MFGFELSSLLLLGQIAEPDAGGDPGGFALMIVMLILIATVPILIGLPIWLGFRHATREREMEHLERMKALELGQPIPSDRSQANPQPCWWTPARLIVAIGAGVPIGVFALAWLAVLTTDASANVVYPSAAAIGVIAVLCGTILAARWIFTQRPLETKPHFDADAYDLSGQHT